MTRGLINKASHSRVFEILQLIAQMDRVNHTRVVDSHCLLKLHFVQQKVAKISLLSQAGIVLIGLLEMIIAPIAPRNRIRRTSQTLCGAHTLNLLASWAPAASICPILVVFEAHGREDFRVILQSAKRCQPVILIEQHFQKLTVVQVEQVAENLEQTVQVVDLLRHVNAPVMLITLIVLHGLGSLPIGLLHFIEYLLQLVQEGTPLCL